MKTKKLKVGDTVKIVSRPENTLHSTNRAMDKTIGLVGKITNIDIGNKPPIRVDLPSIDNYWYYNAYNLEQIYPPSLKN